MPNSYRHGSLKSFSVILKNVDNTRSLDITSLVVDTTIYEDIFAKTMYGSMAIKDGVNLMNGMNIKDKPQGVFPIVGEEYVEITYEVEGYPLIVKRFAVNTITHIKIDEQIKTRDYIIEFCSEEHIIDAVTLVQKSYNKQPISEMVEDVLKNYLKVDQEQPNGKRKKTYDIQKTRGPQNIVVPRLTPLETLEFFARRSIAETIFESASYLFFENKDGFNFCDVEYLIRRGRQKLAGDPKSYTYHYKQMVNPNPTSDGEHSEKVQDNSDEFKTIISMQQKHKFDTIEKLRRGYFESSMLVYDFNGRKVNKDQVFKFLDTYNKSNALGSGSETVTQPAYPENSLDFIKNVTKEPEKPSGILGIFGLTKDNKTTDRHSKVFFIAKDTSPDFPDTYLDQIYPNRAAYMTRLAQNMFTAEVYGDPRIAAGDVIEVNLPEVVGTTGPRQADTYLSGYFLVATIQHKLTADNYMTTYDLFKNGFSNPVISTNNAEVAQSADTAFMNDAKELGVKK